MNIFPTYVDVDDEKSGKKRLVENELWNELVGDLIQTFLVLS